MSKPRSKGPRFSPTLYKAALLTVMAMAFVVPLAFVAMPYLEFFNGMAVQPKLKAQSLYGWGYGMGLMGEFTPPAGTVSRHYHSYPFAGADTQNADTYQKVLDEAGETLTNPTPVTVEVMKRGETLFNIYCIVCHGKDAYGDGSVVGPGRFPAPPSLHTDVAKGYKDGTIFQIITAGKANMPSYADKLTPADRWAVVRYVRVLQRAMDPEPKDIQP